MKNRLIDLMEAYRCRPESEADKSMWEFAREKDPYLFSHHPAAPAFREHVWSIGGLYFCKGCVVTFAGAVAGVVLFAATGWLRWFSDVQLALIFIGLLTPTFVTQWLQLSRWSKHTTRFLLGILMVSAFFLLFVTDSWFIRGAIVGAYFAAKIPMERKRNRDNQRLVE